jgi:hypothetical protein
MCIHLTKRLTYVALLAGFVLPAAALSVKPSHAAPPVPPAAAVQAAPVEQAPVAANDGETIANFKDVLAQYGDFVQLAPYGEVWVPTVTPEGWHPYPPCHWIYAKDVGWYFRDDTPWGAIVHHYGRWSHDAKIGWFWVADADWSPGWVEWRDSADYTGWAPMPPEQEAQQVSLDDFNRDKMWIFMETPVFLKGCGDTVLASNVANVYAATEPVSIFDLPRGRIVDVRIVPRWKIKVIRRIIVVDRICPPRRLNDPPTENGPKNPPTDKGPNTPPTRTLYNPEQPVPVLPPARQVERYPNLHPVFHQPRVTDRHPNRHPGKVTERHPNRHPGNSTRNPNRQPRQTTQRQPNGNQLLHAKRAKSARLNANSGGMHRAQSGRKISGGQFSSRKISSGQFSSRQTSSRQISSRQFGSRQSGAFRLR